MSTDYALSMSGASLRLPDVLITIRAYQEAGDWGEARRRIIDDNLYQLNAESSRKRVSGELVKRLRTLTDDELQFILDSYGDDQRAMLWVSICRTYPFIAHLAQDVVKARYDGTVTDYTVGAFEAFFDRESLLHTELLDVSKEGHKKLRNVTFRLLADCGLVQPTQGAKSEGTITPLHPSPDFALALDPMHHAETARWFPGRIGL